MVLLVSTGAERYVLYSGNAIYPLLAPNRSTYKMTVKKDENFKSFRRFDWYGHQILVWPIAALPNDLSPNRKGVFSVACNAETGLRVWGLEFKA
jgi:hypothetical protein